MYQGNSIVDYLSSSGQRSDFASRAELARSRGIQGYTGSAQQNTQLLNLLRGGTPAPTPAPTTTPTASRPTTTASQPNFMQPNQTSGEPQTVQDLINMGFTGYQGWNDNASAIQDFKETGGAGKRPSFGESGSLTTTPTINLPELYDNLFRDSGITGIEEELSTKTRKYNETVSRIKDNPYLSEATMSGRLSKIEERFNADTQALRGDIATKKADIETRLNLQMKQFDINNQQVQQNLQQFASLLSSGALDRASGEDIANITRSTGLSSNVIRSAIERRKLEDINTEVKSFDDGVNEGFIIYAIDRMGNIVNQTQQITGRSSSSNSGTYSADPTVSNYISNLIRAGSIQSGWDQ